MHKSRQPLGEVDFNKKEDEQLDFFNDHCEPEGGCGV